jgi:hypothetical protein
MNGIEIPATDATGQLRTLTIRHVPNRRPPLTVDVHLADERCLTVDANAAQLQSFGRLQAAVANTLGVWLDWSGLNLRRREVREEWGVIVAEGFDAGAKTA